MLVPKLHLIRVAGTDPSLGQSRCSRPRLECDMGVSLSDVQCRILQAIQPREVDNETSSLADDP